MENFGSQLFGNVKFRDSYVIIGQRGIAKGKAIEFVRIILENLEGKKHFVERMTCFPVILVLKDFKSIQNHKFDQLLILTLLIIF